MCATLARKSVRFNNYRKAAPKPVLIVLSVATGASCVPFKHQLCMIEKNVIYTFSNIVNSFFLCKCVWFFSHRSLSPFIYFIEYSLIFFLLWAKLIHLIVVHCSSIYGFVYLYLCYCVFVCVYNQSIDARSRYYQSRQTLLEQAKKKKLFAQRATTTRYCDSATIMFRLVHKYCYLIQNSNSLTSAEWNGAPNGCICNENSEIVR